VLTFIETKLFTRLAEEYLGDDGLLELQVYLNLVAHSVRQERLGKHFFGDAEKDQGDNRWLSPNETSAKKSWAG
jgi:hypothetical protein